jgi:hypothetical protein
VQLVEAEKREYAKALTKVRDVCKEISFAAGMLRDALAKCRKIK